MSQEIVNVNLDSPGKWMWFVYDNITFKITATDQTGIHTNRIRHFVFCNACECVVHYATTGAECHIRTHVLFSSPDL